MKKDSGAHTELEHAPNKIMIVIVAGPTGAVHGDEYRPEQNHIPINYLTARILF